MYFVTFYATFHLVLILGKECSGKIELRYENKTSKDIDKHTFSSVQSCVSGQCFMVQISSLNEYLNDWHVLANIP